MIITIDGPTASGKSAVANIIANRLHFYYLYSGLLYRALSYVLINFGHIDINLLDSLSYDELKRYADSLKYIYDTGSGPSIFYQKQNITQYLKDYTVDSYVTILASNLEARKIIYNIQRNIALNTNIISDGRDGGTNVFKDAQYKFFLTATPEVRALRWQQSQKNLGKIFTSEQALELINKRDFEDRTRMNSPLRAAQDAIVIDNSNLDLKQTADLIISYIKEE